MTITPVITTLASMGLKGVVNYESEDEKRGHRYGHHCLGSSDDFVLGVSSVQYVLLSAVRRSGATGGDEKKR